MKKLIISLVVLGLIGAVWVWARQQRFTPPWAKPKTAEITRGDIRVPITAPGLINPNQTIEVKAQASGRCIEVPVKEGDFVNGGDLLVQLWEDDEKRTADRAQAELDSASARLQQARVAVKTAAANILSAESEVDRLKAEYSIVKFKYDKIMSSPELYSPEDRITIQAQLDSNLAQQKNAEARLENARNAREDSEAFIKAQEAVVRSAQKTLEEAQQRVQYTRVASQHDAMVTSVSVAPGTIVQSGTGGFSLGTPLMVLADISKKKVVARLDEADYGRVLAISPIEALPEVPGLREAAAADVDGMKRRVGEVTLTIDAFPDRTFKGRIERVEPQGRMMGGSATIQYSIHVEITDEDKHLAPLGAQAQVEFTVESASNSLRVPSEAVKTFEEKKGLWLEVPPPPGSNQKFGKKFVPCRFGITDGEYTQLIDSSDANNPLKEGVTIYTKPPTDEEKED